MNENNSQEIFKMNLPNSINMERVKAFENYTGRGHSTITFIYGSLASGRAVLAEDIVNQDTIVLDEVAQRYYMYPTSPLCNDAKDKEQLENEIAERMAREAYNFAVQGKDVIVIGVNADKSFEYLNNTLIDVNSKKLYIRSLNKYQLGVDIDLRLIKTEGIKSYHK